MLSGSDGALSVFLIAQPSLINIIVPSEESDTVVRGVNIEMAPLDEEHVRAKITWSEQDVGGGKLVVEVTVKNMKTRPKTDDQLRSDARALAVRFARAFADTIEN
jgi:type II secretory pathway predicted ATPase ExeA